MGVTDHSTDRPFTLPEKKKWPFLEHKGALCCVMAACACILSGVLMMRREALYFHYRRASLGNSRVSDPIPCIRSLSPSASLLAHLAPGTAR